ncbi:MAG: AAA domain-containing protein [Bacteroidia bacterium]
MRKILHTYKLRLTNLSQANRSLRLSKLSRRRDIDLCDLGYVEQESPEDILNKILDGKDVVLVKKLDARHPRTNLISRHLNKIYREINTLFEETGAYDLYIGYPFVEGKFLDESTARCPVALFPVRLERDLRARPRWKLTSLADEPVLLNRTFFLAYERFQQQRFSPDFFEVEINRNKDWRAWLNELYELIKSHEVEVNFNSRLFDLKLNSIPDLTAETMANWPLGKLTFQSQAALGIFPRSDSALLQDYEALEAMKPDEQKAFRLDALFPEKNQSDLAPPNPRETKRIREEDRYFVTEVDESQEAALLDVQRGASLALHGPPGTGKSQVIVNLIANAMAHDKRVLLVSQKRAALDVVHKRLETLGLGRFAALVHDHRHDRKAIFAQIRRQLEDTEHFQTELRDLNFTQWEHEYRQVSRQVDQSARMYDELYEALTTLTEQGLSPHELYMACTVKEPAVSLDQESRNLTQDRLRVLLDKLEALHDYRELFVPEHPWAERLSFHAWKYDEQQAIRQLVHNIPTQCASLREEREALKTLLPELSDEPGHNEETLQQAANVQRLLIQTEIREDVEAILMERMSPAKVKTMLDGFAKEVEDLGSLKLFAQFPWGRFEEIETHLKHYGAFRKKPLKLLNLNYLKARWFLKKWLEPQSEKLVPATFTALKREFTKVRRVQRRFGKVYQHGFFEDFPLLESLDEKRRWLVKKESHLHALTALSAEELGSFKPVFDHGHLDEKHWESQQDIARRLDEYNQHLHQAQADWGRYLSKQQIEQLFAELPESAAVEQHCVAMTEGLDADFGDMQQADTLLANLDGTALGVWEKVQQAVETLPESAEDRREAVRQSVLFYWLQQAEQRLPVLARVSGRGWARERKQFARNSAERRKRVTELVSRRVKEQIIDRIEYNRLGNAVTYREIQHQVNKKRRLWSVRRLVKESWESGLGKLLPCWMCSPETAAAIFPLQPDFFDLVIFDEASQCFVERGLPIMLRGKQWIVAGDHMQLQPFDLYKVRYEEGEDELTEYDAALEVESILDLARQRLQEARLAWHYRSRDAALINFSNHAFYDGRLQVVPSAKKPTIAPLQWIAVDGLWEKNTNLAEAEKAIRLVEKLMDADNPLSIGIVTFNFPQQELIKDLLEKRLAAMAEQNDPRYPILQRALLPPAAEADTGLFVKNIENVQGDERDVIIFSIGYAPNEAGKLNAQFGLLSQRGGENRLNVAISRAKERSYVLCSFRPEALQVAESKHPGPRLLKRFLQYAYAMSEGRTADAFGLLDSTAGSRDLELPNPLADEVAQALEARGYRISRNLGDTNFKLDLAIQNAAGEHVLGIRCEGPHYFSGSTAKAREIYRRELLAQRGWKLCHVWARNWRIDAEKELERIVDMLG